MDLNIRRELAALPRLTPKELRAKYAEVFGEETPGNNKTWLVKRIAWRLQSLAEGGLSDRAQQRAAELANEADLRLNPPRAPAAPAAAEQAATATLPRTSDARLPQPGTILTRAYKGAVVQVQVLSHGFEYQGAVYQSLSAVAKAVTGSHCNGYFFFRLDRQGDA